MRKWVMVGLWILLLAGCSAGEYQISKQDYQAKVQVLGVLPLLVDTAAPFAYPQREPLLDLVSRTAVGKQEPLVERLRKKKGYFDVRPLSGSPELLAISLLNAEKPRNAEEYPMGYQFNQQSIAELAERNVVDALLVVVLSGTDILETRRSRTMLESLETRFSDVVAIAAVVDRNGKVLWELTGKDAFQIATLQYADFDEAYYNRTDLVRVKNISLEGIEKALDKKAGEKPENQLPEVYAKLFERIVSGISPGLLDSLK